MDKKILMIISTVLIVLLVVGALCITNSKNLKYEISSENNKKALEENYSFLGTVVECGTKYLIVEPDENEEERKSSDKFSISLGQDSDEVYAVGTRLEVTYTGEIMESYPAQIKVVKIEVKSSDEA